MVSKISKQWMVVGLTVVAVSSLIAVGFLLFPARSGAQEPEFPTPPGIDPAALREVLGVAPDAEMPVSSVTDEKKPDEAEKQTVPKRIILPSPENEHASYFERQREMVAQEQQALEELRAEIKRDLQQLEVIRGEIDQRLAQEDEITRKKVARLVKIYESMRPDDLVKVLEKLDEALRLQVMFRMKQKVVSQVLVRMEPSEAARISAKLLKK